MQDKYSEIDDSDTDRTDELPVLSMQAIVASGGGVSELDETLDDDVTGEHWIDFSREAARADSLGSHDHVALAALQESLASAREALAERDRRLAKLQENAERQRGQLAELRATLSQHQQSHAELEQQLAAAKSELARQHELIEASAAAADRTRPYRDEIQALTAYITGRRERWREMEILVGSQTERIADLERELEQRVARQKGIEQAGHDEAARAQELRTKLAETATLLRAREQELTVLKRAKTAERPRAQTGETSTKLAHLQGHLQEQERQLQAAHADRTTLEQRLQEVEASLVQSRADFARLEKRLLEKNKAVDRQDERIAALQQELSERVAALRGTQAAGVPSGGGAPKSSGEPAAAARELPVLVCLTSERPERHPITEPEITIGRGAECAIRILTHFVSRVHARVKREPGKVTIEDCGSTNGVFVNSVRVERHELVHGDWITIGETQFRFLNEVAV